MIDFYVCAFASQLQAAFSMQFAIPGLSEQFKLSTSLTLNRYCLVVQLSRTATARQRRCNHFNGKLIKKGSEKL
jgi:hypothetical protein